MFFLKFLWTAIAHPEVIIVLLIVAIALAAYGYFRGIPAVLKIVTSPAFWIALVIGVLALAVKDLKQDNDKLHQEVQASQQTQQATDDGVKVTDHRQQQQVKRQTEDHRIEGAIANAKPGDAEDAALDAIDAIHAENSSDTGKHGRLLDGLLHHEQPQPAP